MTNQRVISISSIAVTKEERNSNSLMFCHMGLREAEFREMTSLSFIPPQGVFRKVLDMSGDELTALVMEAGILPENGINPASMEGLEFLLLWLYLSGRTDTYGLNSYGKIDWKARNGLKEWDLRSNSTSINWDVMECADRLRAIIKWPKDMRWILPYFARNIINGTADERYSALHNIMFYCGNSIVRSDYKPLDGILDVGKIKHRREKLCRNRINFYCMLDRIRISACHIYPGNRSDFSTAMKGGRTCQEKIAACVELYKISKSESEDGKIVEKMEPVVILPSLKQKDNLPQVKQLIKCLKLESHSEDVSEIS